MNTGIPAQTMQVTIAGIVGEYQVPANDMRWNGWAVPGFTLEQVHQLAADINARIAAFDRDGKSADDIDTIRIDADGTVTIHGPHGDTTRVDPASDGLYYIGAQAWTWDTLDNG